MMNASLHAWLSQNQDPNLHLRLPPNLQQQVQQRVARRSMPNHPRCDVT